MAQAKVNLRRIFVDPGPFGSDRGNHGNVGEKRQAHQILPDVFRVPHMAFPQRHGVFHRRNSCGSICHRLCHRFIYQIQKNGI